MYIDQTNKSPSIDLTYLAAGVEWTEFTSQFSVLARFVFLQMPKKYRKDV